MQTFPTPGPGADVGGASPVPVQIWAGRAQSRHKCGWDEPSPGTDGRVVTGLRSAEVAAHLSELRRRAAHDDVRDRRVEVPAAQRTRVLEYPSITPRVPLLECPSSSAPPRVPLLECPSSSTPCIQIGQARAIHASTRVPRGAPRGGHAAACDDAPGGVRPLQCCDLCRGIGFGADRRVGLRGD
jgi:hypothetical protein